MQKRYLFVAILLIFTLAIAACGGGGAEAEPTKAPESTKAPAAEPTEAPADEAVEDISADADVSGIEKVRVAIVMPSTITDLAWSQSLYDTFVRIQTELGGEDMMEIAYTENMFNVTDAASAIRDYADDGYNLVIAHGTQYGTSLFEIAPDFPETSFAWGTAVDTGKETGITNVFAYEARAEEGGFVNGVLAANLSESGVVGVVGPVEAGDAKLYIDGFEPVQNTPILTSKSIFLTPVPSVTQPWLPRLPTPISPQALMC